MNSLLIFPLTGKMFRITQKFKRPPHGMCGGLFGYKKTRTGSPFGDVLFTRL